MRPDVHQAVGLLSNRHGRGLTFGHRGDLLTTGSSGGGDFVGHARASWTLGNGGARGGGRRRRYGGRGCWGWSRRGSLRACATGRLTDAGRGGALLVNRRALGGRQALHVWRSLERHQSGPEMPPSLRIRQKWTAIRTAVMSGMPIT